MTLPAAPERTADALRVVSLDKDQDYFEIQASSVQWWTAKLCPDGGWYVVNQYGREAKSGGKVWRKIVTAVLAFRARTAARTK